MNQLLFRSQLKKNLLSWKLVVIVGVSIGLVILEQKTTNNWHLVKSNNFLHYVVLMDKYSLAGVAYLLVLPILSALLGGTIYSGEFHSGRIISLQARLSRREIIKTISLSSFILGGIAAVIPILGSVPVAFVVLSRFDFISGNSNFSIFESNFWGYSLYEHSQIALILILLGLLFIFGGLVAVVSTVISFYTKIKYIELLLPFVFSLIWFLLVSAIGFPEMGHIVFLDFPVSSGFPNVDLYLTVAYFILAIGSVVLITRKERNDDFA
ncbi:hypothetical protein [Lactococcus allomyrinae]|nr:hypothetical protein [Lactococcus allomyrinae]